MTAGFECPPRRSHYSFTLTPFTSISCSASAHSGFSVRARGDTHAQIWSASSGGGVDSGSSDANRSRAVPATALRR